MKNSVSRKRIAILSLLGTLALMLVLVLVLMTTQTSSVAFANELSDNVQTEWLLENSISTFDDDGEEILLDPLSMEPLSSGVIEIENSHIIRGMYVFGQNNGTSCGPVAMGMLLDFYNYLYTCYSGGIIPNNNWNQRLGTSVWDRLTRANNLHNYLVTRTPATLGNPGWGTVHTGHRTGLNRYLNDHTSNINAVARSTSSTGEDDNRSMDRRIRDLLDNDIPVLITMVEYNYVGEQGNDQNTEKGKPHVVLAFGYRIVGGRTQFLAHSGWWRNQFYNGAPRGSAMWFSRVDALFTQFLWGYAFLDITPRFNTTLVSGGVRIDGLTYDQHIGALEIPSHINGQPVVAIGASAFANQTTLSQITLPSTVGTTKSAS